MASEINQHDLLNEIAIRRGLNRNTVHEVYGDFVTLLRRYLRDGHDVVLSRLCKFEVVHREARTARNPSTGESIQVPEKDVIKIRRRSGLTQFEDLQDLQEPETEKQQAALDKLYTDWINPKLAEN